MIQGLATPTGRQTSVTRRRSSFKPLIRRRHNDRLAVEKSFRQPLIIGSDESGVGCIAGPIVCVSCCFVQPHGRIEQCDRLGKMIVQDGKTLSIDQCQVIRQYADQNPNMIQYVTTVKSNQEIDQYGIYHCVQSGFQHSISSLVQNLLGKMEMFNNIKNNDNRTNMEYHHFIYSIVDGHRSPSFPNFTSRPWPHADSTVYTVAVAGCIARAIHAEMMANYPPHLSSSSFLNPNDDDDDIHTKNQIPFQWDGGYPTMGHLHSLALHGPTKFHRQSCKPVQLHRRRSALLSMLLPLFAIVPLATPWEPSHAMVKERGMLLPERGEVSAAVPTDWSNYNNNNNMEPIINEPLGRLDETDDAIFYTNVRLVEHIDESALAALKTYLSNVVIMMNSPAILDVGASWTSHLEGIITSPNRRVVGIGMNANELSVNKVLTDRIVQNLNIQTTLPLDTSSFDIALCQLTIDYLTRPISVCKELRRVLKKDESSSSSASGTIHIIFSNRLFLQKAVENWAGRDDLDHIETVASYLHYAGFRDIEALDLSIRNKKGSIVGDPLYVVRAKA